MVVVRQLEKALRMGWVNDALQQLSAGRHVQIRPSGGSMRGRIESGDLVTLAPVVPSEIRVDDVVLVRWKGNYLLHLIREIRGDEFVIGNNLGKINGMAKGTDIRGRVIGVAHDAKPAEPGGAANRSQPVSPETNRTSAAAASRRSP